MFRHYYAAFDMWFYDYYKSLASIMVNVLGNRHSDNRFLYQIFAYVIYGSSPN